MTASTDVTVQQAATGASTVAERILDLYRLTVNVPSVFNWWIAVPNNDYFEGFASNATTSGASHGYTYA